MPAKFLIEDDWFLLEDKYSWNLGRHEKKGGRFKDLTYHATPEQAIAHYLKYCRSEALHEAARGTIDDVLDILTRQNEKLLCTLRAAFTTAYKEQPEEMTDLTDDDLAALDEDPEDQDNEDPEDEDPE